jgi:hypothetical protein
MLEAGQSAPQFTLPDQDGDPVSLTSEDTAEGGDTAAGGPMPGKRRHGKAGC